MQQLYKAFSIGTLMTTLFSGRQYGCNMTFIVYDNNLQHNVHSQYQNYYYYPNIQKSFKKC